MYKESNAGTKVRWPRTQTYRRPIFVGILSITLSAMTAWAVVGSSSSGIVSSSGQHLMAQTDSNQMSNDEASATGVSPSELEPPISQTFSWQGDISSSPSRLPDRNDTQTAIILNPRTDGGVYDGILTYHSTRPVLPVVWTVVSPTNATAVIPEEFGGMTANVIPLSRNAQVILSPLQEEASTSGSLMFVGDAFELVGEEGSVDEPFIATYSLLGQPSNRTIVNSLESITGFNSTETSEN
ncbi:MAG TPA: hypothetical protein VE130_12315 [Nitrososphaeraceae archaeon]|nr:hypothetical protein [Nitrososphaeraceae archaeon]